jgi:2-amino-4-hydroxy-6-hydroxymethyldihydropteridine diphosphokinase
MIAWLSLGSNLQDPQAQIERALDSLGKANGLDILRRSSLYRTPPWGDEQQDDFINAVAELKTSLEPLPLLRQLQGIENVMGRQRDGRRWGPRLIDLDLLLYGELQFYSDELEIPHPRMHERAFVLMPMSELDNTVKIPGHGEVGKLLKKLDVSGIKRLENSALVLA